MKEDFLPLTIYQYFNLFADAKRQCRCRFERYRKAYLPSYQGIFADTSAGDTLEHCHMVDIFSDAIRSKQQMVFSRCSDGGTQAQLTPKVRFLEAYLASKNPRYSGWVDGVVDGCRAEGAESGRAR